MSTSEITPSAVLNAGASGGTGSSWRDLWPAAVVVLAFLPLLAWHACELWGRPHYQFFPLLVPCVAALVARKCLRLGPLEPGSRATGNVLAVLTWLALAVAVLFASPRAAAIAGLVAVPAAAYALGGRRLVLQVVPAWCLLWLAVPPPYRLDYRLVESLQDLVSRWSSDFLDALGVYHLTSGHVVEVAGRELLVDQACSGIYSLLSLLLAALSYVFWVRASVARAVGLLLATVFWVLFGNVVRIVTVVALYKKTGIDTAAGWRHEVLGILIFVVMMAMVLSTDRLLSAVSAAVVIARRLFTNRNAFLLSEPVAGPIVTPEPTAVVNEPEVSPRTVLPRVGRTWIGSPWSGVAFGVLFAAQFAMPGVSLRDVMTANTLYDKAFEPLGAQALPDRVGHFERTGFRTVRRDAADNLGEYSRVWEYGKAASPAVVSLDYKFVDWHDLDVCYADKGWTLTGRRVETLAGSNAGMGNGRAAKRTVVVADYVDLEGRYGHLVFGIFDKYGRTVTSPWLRQWYASGLLDRLAGWGRRGPARDPSFINYQVQVFVQSEVPVAPALRAEALGLFAEAATRIGNRLPGSGGVIP